MIYSWITIVPLCQTHGKVHNRSGIQHGILYRTYGWGIGNDFHSLSIFWHGRVIRPFCIMLLYRYLLHYVLLLHICHNTYAFSILFYKVYMKRENVGSWNSGLEKEQNIRDLFCTTPKVLKLHESQFWNILKILGEESTRGGPPTVHEGGGAPYPPGRAPLPCGPPGRPPVPIFCYMMSFALEKIRRQLSGRSDAVSRRNQTRAPAELFCRGNIPPGGGNHRHCHHQRSSHPEGVNLHQHLHQHHLLSKP